MPKKHGQKTPSYGYAAQDKRKKLDSYEDTLEPGSVDDFMFKRDQILFNEREESDDDIAVGDEVMAIGGGDEEEDYAEEAAPVAKKGRKEKVVADRSGQGRFGKAVADSDDEASGSGSDSDSEEGWGRQYYAMPSSRREKETDEYDEQRAEDRELEEREVRRLQRKAREQLLAEDFGLDDVAVEEEHEEEEETPVVAPTSTDPSVLLRHMEVHEPIKLALAREWPLVVLKLEKTQRGMRKLEADPEGQLHKGLGWLHYQTLVTYASTLAFYIHLAALPPASRPDLSTHPILTRLYELKKALSDLESLDFDAASVDGDALLPPGWESESEGEESAERELVRAKKELIARMQGGDSEEDEDEDSDDDSEDGWQDGDLEDGELEELMAEMAQPKAKGKGKGKAPVKAPVKAAKGKGKALINALAGTSFTLAEPSFTPSRKATPAIDADDELGDPSALLDADAEDKAQRKRSLAFHTAKIASTASRRAAAREKRMGGDEDVPRRDRQAARDAALRKNNRGGEGEALDGSEFSESDRKRAREVRDEDEDGYYDLVKRARLSSKAAKQAAHDEATEERLAARIGDEEGEDGPRSLTRAIEKNRGLTPHRSKSKGGRNPRVKKRQQYEKAKQRVGSQRAVYKGGQAAVGGRYEGERTGISVASKSSRF